MPTKLTTEIITAAIEGFDSQKARIDQRVADLRAMLSGPARAAEAPVRRRKKFSPAARRKMALAQKARWAKIRGESEPQSTAMPEGPKAKRRLSAAGRKAIIAATKRRWAAVKAAKAQQEKPAANKMATKKAIPKRRLSPAVRAKLAANLAKARAAKAAKAKAA